MNTKSKVAIVTAAMVVIGCSVLTTEQQKNMYEGTSKADNSSNTAISGSVNLIKEGSWVYDQFTLNGEDWVSIPGINRELGPVDSIVINTNLEKTDFFGIDGILGNSIGDFDSIRVVYKSNYAFQACLATTDDKNGWESFTKAPKSEQEYRSVTFKSGEFEQTWGDSTSIGISNIVAFTNDNSAKLVDGPLNVTFREIVLYK